MLGTSISLEKTKFIDVPTFISWIQSHKLMEMLVLMEDGLIEGINELISYGKVGNSIIFSFL